MNEIWDKRFLKLAKEISTWSKDPSTKVGAVIVDQDKKSVSWGYNGFPRGVLDEEERYNDRPTKLSMVVHAEANAILNSSRPLLGCILYCYPLFTCNECAKLIIQSGIKRVVAPENKNPLWESSIKTSLLMYKEANIEVVFLDL